MSKQRTPATRSTTSKSSTTSDYVLVAINFAEDAIADSKRQRHGKWIRLAARRFLRDLKRAQRKRPPFVFSPGRANHACAFVERLPHVEGSWPSRTIILQPFQVFFLVQLFGFRQPNGDRRFTTALFAVARKNAKSTLAAAVLLYVLCTEREQGPQIYSAATTGNQARIVWNIARMMVDRLPALREAFDLETFANSIARYETGGSFRPINARASSQDGLNPSALCLDELHAHKTADLRNVLISAAGARRNPLFLITTTEGYEWPGPWAEERAFAQHVLEGVLDADHYFAIIFALDDDDGDFDAAKWCKANPLLASSPTLLAAIERDAMEAKSKPGAAAEFKIKRLNRRSTSARGCIDLTKFRRCGGRVDLEQLVGAPCWAAYDGASTGDMAAWRLLWFFDDRWWTWGRYWVPRAAVVQRTERGSVNYQAWIDAGLVTATDGDVIDYSIIERDILQDCALYAPRRVAYDPYNATQLALRLQDEGVPVVQFIQGSRSYHPAWQAFEIAYTSGRLVHSNDPVLVWNCANLIDRRDVNMNFAPDKRRAPDKIDGACCLLMTFGLAVATDDEGDFGKFIANPIIA